MKINVRFMNTSKLGTLSSHTGKTARRFREEYPEPTIRRLEPIRRNFKELSTISITLGTHHPMTLGAKQERVGMRIHRSSVMHSLAPDLYKPEQDDLGEEEVGLISAEKANGGK
jgi:hypothetical protein